jgi:hypothetical protein
MQVHGECPGFKFRAVLVSHSRIVCHDCELTSRDPDIRNKMMSWAGSPDEFFQNFRELPSDHYPKTAGTP